MSRVRNADQFLMEFRRRRNIYERHYIRLCENIQQQYANVPNRSHADATSLKVQEDVLLEAHARVGMINALLGALNWRMDVSVEDDCVNLIPEAPLVSVSSHTRRFLDYFGLEQDNGRPLLIVESKRPSSELPERSISLTNHYPSARDSFATDPERVVAEVIARGLAGQSIPGGWNEWLTTLRDYVRSAQQQSGHTLRRVVITNGNWLVLFLDPADAFIGNDICDPAQILVYGNRDAIERRHAELFRALEHQSLLSQARALTLGELRFAVAPGTIDHAMKVCINYFPIVSAELYNSN